MPHFHPFRKAAEARKRAIGSPVGRFIDTVILFVVLTVLMSGLAALLLHDVTDEPDERAGRPPPARCDQ